MGMMSPSAPSGTKSTADLSRDDSYNMKSDLALDTPEDVNQDDMKKKKKGGLKGLFKKMKTNKKIEENKDKESDLPSFVPEQ